MKILITGAVGFIGYYLSRRLAERGDEVVGQGCMCEQRRTRSVVATSTGAADHPASPGRMTVQVP